MKKPLIALACVLALPLVPSVALADLAFNIGAVTDYRFRGISQTRAKPAVQGGVDFSAGAFYLGAWASNIKWVKDLGGDAGVEVDLYGGITGEITPGVGYDVGVLTYQYPSNKLNPSANTTELYGAVSYGVFGVKYSHAVTDTFGNPDSANSFYLEGKASFDVGHGISLVPHIGYQKIKGPVGAMATYTDYSLTASKDVGGVTLSLALVGTDADKAFYASPVNGKVLGKNGVVLGAKFSF